MRIVCVLVLISVVRQSLQISTVADDHYVAAVVEFQITDDNQFNLDRYTYLIGEAASQGADIIVFPELTLTTSIAVPFHGLLKRYPIPALRNDLYDTVLVTISLFARVHLVYIVINTRERLDCTQPQEGEECPEKKVYVFNTNVVFDRDGAIIDRYRKINLFGEIGHAPALKPELGKFTTNFGVTFGHFICMDLLYQVPTIQVIQKHNIKDIIFPTMWYSQQPYLTSIQIQQAYAFAMDVNFLAAGANDIKSGNAGSGIYSGKAGSLISIMPTFNTTKVLVAKVPKTPGKVNRNYPGHIAGNPKDYDSVNYRLDRTMRNHESRLLQPGLDFLYLELEAVQCVFLFKMPTWSNSKYKYRAVAYNGPRTFGGRPSGGVQSCAIVSCTNDDVASCGEKFPKYEEGSTAIFEFLKIYAYFPKPVIVQNLQAVDSVVFPQSLTTSYAPLGVNDFSYETHEELSTNLTDPRVGSKFIWKRDSLYKKARNVGANNDATVYAVHTLSLKSIAAELYTFGLWGRLYNQYDYELTHMKSNSSRTKLLSSVLITSIMVFIGHIVCYFLK